MSRAAPAGMDGIRENFPRAADAVLHVPVQNGILCAGIGRLDRGTISQQPRFAFLNGNPEQRSRTRPARIQHVKQLLLECPAIPGVQVHNDDNRGRLAETLETSPVCLQERWQSIQKNPFLAVRDTAQILRDATKTFVGMYFPGMNRPVCTENLFQNTVKRNAPRPVLNQHFKMHRPIPDPDSRCTRGRQAAGPRPPWP